MAFVKGDKNINRRGRPPKTTENIGINELKRLAVALHKLTPKAVERIATLMGSQKDEVAFKAALSLLQQAVVIQREYDRKLAGGEVPTNDDDVTEKNEKPATLSLKLVTQST